MTRSFDPSPLKSPDPTKSGATGDSISLAAERNGASTDRPVKRRSIAAGVRGNSQSMFPSCSVRKWVHPVNGEVPPVKGRPWKLPHYANRGKTSSSRGELASARSCFSTVRTALGKLRITGLLARFDVARSFPQFPRPLLLQPTIWTSERGADLGSGRCQPRPHLPIYRMTQKGSSGKWGGAASQRQAVETAALCKPWKNN